MSRYKAILFDFDDTIINTFPARVEAARMAASKIIEADLDIETIMKERAGEPQWQIWKDLSGDEAKADRLIEEYMDAYWGNPKNRSAPFPGVEDMLTGVKDRGLLIGLVTSKTRQLERNQRTYGAAIELERVGLAHFFDLVIGWEDVTESKPAPEPVLLAVNRLGVAPEEAMMVGDSHVDVTASKAAGVPSVGATWGTLARKLLIDSGPDYLIDSPHELLPLIS